MAEKSGRNVLVAIDQSTSAFTALDRALAMLGDEDHLYILSVALDGGNHMVVAPYLTNTMWESVREKVHSEAKNSLCRAGRICLERGFEKPRFTLAISNANHAGEAICDYAKEHHIDHVIMGRRGMSTLQRVVMGSTSKYVMENCNADVTICKPPQTDSKAQTGFRSEHQKVEMEE
mmetsp:Transcript_19855/g.55803  ORF Transcript_19855/g.55803 Transcript_19855/m.55803 type:complete len:176 (+) Transcript_19855:214-741(+)